MRNQVLGLQFQEVHHVGIRQGERLHIFKVGTVFVVIAMLLAMVQVPVLAKGTVPAVSTDKADYQPGGTVTVKGSGFAAGASYDVVIMLPDGSYHKGPGGTYSANKKPKDATITVTDSIGRTRNGDKPG